MLRGVTLLSGLLSAAFWGSALLGSALLGGRAQALPTDNPWPQFKEPKRGAPRAIGDYSAGCVQGAVPLALDGPGYQVMRPSRVRYYGHPELVDFVRGLGKRARAQKLSVVLVGDLGQPRGGRSNGGHSSHQTGLDVDVWFWHPKSARSESLAMDVRDSLSARSILQKTKTQMQIVPAWKNYARKLLKLAVEDERVDRVFVNPHIKRELCDSEPDETARAWLHKLRPWHGHDDHFHARLRCPKDSQDCKPQAELPAGDGCDKLAWWFDEKAQAERKKAQAEYQHSVDKGRGWPAQCEALLEVPEELDTAQVEAARGEP